MNLLINCNAKQIPLADNSVNCCVTSPPYYGLRDYGTAKWEGGDPNCKHYVAGDGEPGETHAGIVQQGNKGSMRKAKDVCPHCGAIRIDNQIGLEQTPDEYIANLVQVFREVKRVLRDDGIVFLNLGDSYFSGAQHAKTYGTSCKELVDCQESDCLCESLCDVCREVYRRKSHTYNLLAPMLIASLSAPTLKYIGFERAHLPTWDFSLLETHIFPAIRELLHSQDHEGERLLAYQASMPDEFSRQLLGVCLRRDNYGECLLCGRSFSHSARESVDKLDALPEQPLRIQDNALHGAQRERHNQYKDRVFGYCIGNGSYQDYTTEYHLKPKDLIGIPWMAAFALRADGWYLRQDIIWAKPNPMPESVKDRCTKAHEYVFLLSKSAQYYYDYEAILEPAVTSPDDKSAHRFGAPNGKVESTPGKKHLESGEKWQMKYKNLQPDGQQPNTMHLNRLDGEEYLSPVRNKRSVWTVTTKPYRGAHFATFPPDLIKPMILAGCPKGGVVLDPFVGSGTTVMVANQLGRQGIGLDLNPKYLKLAQERVKEVQPILI